MVSFPPQPVITSDNLVVNIDTVIYYSVIDAKSAVYEIANFIQGIEQLTVTTPAQCHRLLDLEETLTSRDQINSQLRGVLDEATGKWGIRVNRVELQGHRAADVGSGVDGEADEGRAGPARRDSHRRGHQGLNILTAEGEKQSQILRAEGSAQARILEAQGPGAGDPGRSSTRSTGEADPSCSPINTSRSSRSSPAATPTRCGSSRPSDRRPARIGNTLGGGSGARPWPKVMTSGSTPVSRSATRSPRRCWRTRASAGGGARSGRRCRERGDGAGPRRAGPRVPSRPVALLALPAPPVQAAPPVPRMPGGVPQRSPLPTRRRSAAPALPTGGLPTRVRELNGIRHQRRKGRCAGSGRCGGNFRRTSPAVPRGSPRAGTSMTSTGLM